MEKSYSKKWDRKSSDFSESDDLDTVDTIIGEDGIPDADDADSVVDFEVELKTVPNVKTSTTASWNGVNIGLGSKDFDAVEAIQRAIGIEVNGAFDRHTRDKVRTWQQEHGLVVTGTVDFKTWKSMFNI